MQKTGSIDINHHTTQLKETEQITFSHNTIYYRILQEPEGIKKFVEEKFIGYLTEILQ